MGKRILPVLLFALLAFGARAGESGFASRPADIVDRPEGGARAVGKLAKQQPLEILGRNASWLQVKTGNASGWVRLLDVRLNTPSKVGPVARVKPSADNGIRGFSEEDLLAGTPGRGEIDKLNLYGVPVKEAVSFARASGLKARQQDYIEPADYMSMDELPEDFFDE